MSNFLIYKASAGSGKTYNLALQYILRLILEGENAFRQILAVTFTNDATAEMKLRILSDLYALSENLPESKGFLDSIKKELQIACIAGADLQSVPVSETAHRLQIGVSGEITDLQIRQTAKKALTAILHDYSHFNVGTIDSFFQRILKNLARELGHGSRLNIDLNQSKAIREAVKVTIEQSAENPELLAWLEEFVDEKIERENKWRIDLDLNRFGEKIFNETFQQKQSALMQRIKDEPDILQKSIKKCQIIRKNFLDKMEDFVERYRKIHLENGLSGIEFYKDFINAYYDKIYNKEFRDENLPSRTAMALESAENWFIKKSEFRGRLLPLVENELLPLLAETEQFRTENYPDYCSAQLFLQNVYSLGLLQHIANEIDVQSRENNRFMLQNTAIVLSAMINENHDSAFIYEKIGAEIRNVMIDEFQDTSHLQWKNFSALLAEIAASGEFSMLVGDVKQSIYRWRNGDWRILNSIENELNFANIRHLDTNYRSYENIIDFNNHIFGRCAAQLADEFEKLCGTEVENPFKKAYSDVRQIAAKKNGEGFISVDFLDRIGYDNQAFNTVIEILVKLEENNVPPEEICILCRTNQQVQKISEFLESKQQEFPVLKEKHYLDIISNEAFLLVSSSVLQTLIAALRVINTPQNPVHYAELCFLWNKSPQITPINTDNFSFKEQNITDNQQNTICENLCNLWTELSNVNFTNVFNFFPFDLQKENLEKLKLLPLYELIMTILQVFDSELLTKQSAYIFTFLDSVLSYLQEKSSDIGDFVKFWDEELQTRSVNSNSAMKGIRVTTIHKAKGLEFGTVILPFCFGDMSELSRGGKKNIVWCNQNVPPFDLPIMPIEYNRMMKNSVFSKDFIEETVMLWMDNLNVNYVAFTRAVKNLFICSRKSPKSGELIRFERLLHNCLDLDYDVFHGETGKIVSKVPDEKDKKTLNPLKNQGIEQQKNHFRPTKDALKKLAFVQSNSSREFLFGEDGEKSPYIIAGNVMHALFSKIFTENDIENAVDTLIFEGIIAQNERQKYIDDIKTAISESDVKDWFSDKYQFFNEKEILSKSGTHRPDRVMISTSPTPSKRGELSGNDSEEVIVVDYKFGQLHPKHNEQVKEYINLLKSIGYENISGYLWYVNEREKVKIP